MVCKIIFCSEFLDILDKAGRVTRRRTHTISKRFAFYAYAIIPTLTLLDLNITSENRNQFEYSRRSRNQISNNWTSLHISKNADCSWYKKLFELINRSIKYSNYLNSLKFLNTGSTGVPNLLV